MGRVFCNLAESSSLLANWVLRRTDCWVSYYSIYSSNKENTFKGNMPILLNCAGRSNRVPRKLVNANLLAKATAAMLFVTGREGLGPRGISPSLPPF